MPISSMRSLSIALMCASVMMASTSSMLLILANPRRPNFDAVDTHKQFAERTARQNAFTVFAHHRFTAVTQHASQLNDVDIVLL